MLKPGDFDWPSIFARGVRWFHSGGIFAALSETTSEVIIEGMKAAKASGAVTSFDLNYRAKLWASIGGDKKGQESITIRSIPLTAQAITRFGGGPRGQQLGAGGDKLVVQGLRSGGSTFGRIG